MVSDTSGVSGACGKGFDSVVEAQAWCDEFIMDKNQHLIDALLVQVAVLTSELAGARSRM